VTVKHTFALTSESLLFTWKQSSSFMQCKSLWWTENEERLSPACFVNLGLFTTKCYNNFRIVKADF